MHTLPHFANVLLRSIMRHRDTGNTMCSVMQAVLCAKVPWIWCPRIAKIYCASGTKKAMETMNFPKVWKTGTAETMKTTTKKMKIMTSKMVLLVVVPPAETITVLVAGFVANPDITAARALCSTADLAVVRRMRRKMTRSTK